MTALITNALLEEYDSVIQIVGPNASVGELIQELEQHHAWTRDGATTVIRLAQMYGTAILRNALALASAMNIEDGDSGM